MDSLFLRLAAMYGHVWRSLYKSDEFLAFTKKEWAEALMQFDDLALEKAVRHGCKHWEYPPTLPQLVESCKAWTVQAPTVIASDLLKPANREIAMQHLAKIKSILNSNH